MQGVLLGCHGAAILGRDVFIPPLALAGAIYPVPATPIIEAVIRCWVITRTLDEFCAETECVVSHGGSS